MEAVAQTLRWGGLVLSGAIKTMPVDGVDAGVVCGSELLVV